MLQPLVDNIKDAWPREKKNIKDACAQFHNIVFSHIYREYNMKADAQSKSSRWQYSVK